MVQADQERLCFRRRGPHRPRVPEGEERSDSFRCPDSPTCFLPAVFLVPPVFVTLTCAFRYGREDLDVLGLTFRKDLFMANSQTFPSPLDPERSLSRLQERLMKKLGEHAHPFTFQVASTQPWLTGCFSLTEAGLWWAFVLQSWSSVFLLRVFSDSSKPAVFRHPSARSRGHWQGEKRPGRPLGVLVGQLIFSVFRPAGWISRSTLSVQKILRRKSTKGKPSSPPTGPLLLCMSLPVPAAGTQCGW